MINNTPKPCSFCGLPLPERTTNKGFAPQVHPECGKASNDFNRFIKALEAIPSMEASKRKQLAGDLFALTSEVHRKK